MSRLFYCLLISVALVACNRAEPPAPSPAPVSNPETVVSELSEQDAVVARAQAPLLSGLGDFNHPITTSDPWAQRYFNQGMIMAAGFNHAESVRAFKAAQRLDPACAM